MIPSKEKLLKMEEDFRFEQFEVEPFIIENGHLPVLISAPHSVAQLRNGKPKLGEYLTGVLVQLLREDTDCYAAYKTKNTNDDANFDESNPYKDALTAHIKKNNILYLLDLHIMSNSREHLVDLGTARGRNIQQQFEKVEMIQRIFNNNGIEKVEIDQIFTAGNPNTVSATISRVCQIFSLQIEINWSLLQIDQDIQSFSNVYRSLKEIIQFLATERNEQI